MQTQAHHPLGACCACGAQCKGLVTARRRADGARVRVPRALDGPSAATARPQGQASLRAAGVCLAHLSWVCLSLVVSTTESKQATESEHGLLVIIVSSGGASGPRRRSTRLSRTRRKDAEAHEERPGSLNPAGSLPAGSCLPPHAVRYCSIGATTRAGVSTAGRRPVASPRAAARASRPTARRARGSRPPPRAARRSPPRPSLSRRQHSRPSPVSS